MKNKRAVSLILAASMFVPVLGVDAAISSGMKDVTMTEKLENVSISIPAMDSQKIIKSTNFDIEVDFLQKGENSKYYTVECYVDDKLCEKQQVSVSSGNSVSKKISLTNVKQGPCNISVKVMSNARVVKEFSRDVTVIIPYKKNFMDSYSNRGICGLDWTSEKSAQLYDLIGFTNFRSGREWTEIETSPGVYNWELARNSNKLYENNYPAIIYMGAYNNHLYNGIPLEEDIMSRTRGATTTKNFEAYAKYMVEAKAAMPTLKYMECYNEPNIQFWRPQNSVDYTYMCDITYRELKEKYDDVVMLTGVMAGGDSGFTKKIMEDGAYGNMDSLCMHPYIYPAKADNALQIKFDQNEQVLLQYGGWKTKSITELGWTTMEGPNGTPVDQQAIELVKSYIICDSDNFELMDAFCMQNPSDNVNEKEHNFGIAYVDFSPKPAVSSLKEFFQRTNGGQYMGKMTLNENQIGHMYLHDNKITGVMWQKATTNNASKVDMGSSVAVYDAHGNFLYNESKVSREETSKVDLGQQVSVYDIYGNFLYSSNVVTLTESPVYVEGISVEYAMSQTRNNIIRIFDEKLSLMNDVQELDGYKAVKEKMYRAAELAPKEKVSEEEALSNLEEYYKVADEIIAMQNRGEFAGDATDVSSLLYIFHQGGELMMKQYMAACIEGSKDCILSADEKINDAENVIKKNAGYGTMSHSEAILKFAKKRRDNLNKLAGSNESNLMKSAVMKAWDKSVELICHLSESLSVIEPVGYDNILLQLPSNECVLETNIKRIIYPAIHNYTSADINGHVELYDPDGIFIAASNEFTILSKKSMEIPMTVCLDEVKETDRDKGITYKLRYVNSDGQTVKEIPAYLEIKKNFEVKLEAVETTFESMNEIELTISNLSNEGFTGVVELVPPEGWEFAEKTARITVDGNEAKTITFGISQKTDVPYHFYTFGINVKNSEGKLLYNKKLPLSFAVAVESDKEYYTENFDGDISDWSNAYPLYPGTPDDPDEFSSWSSATIAARVLMKWDKNYLYFLVDVFDDAHIQTKPGNEIYNGDCVQISIDPNNDKNDLLYATEDYEYGFAYSDQGGNVAWSWYSAKRPGGSEPSEWTVMLRDNKQYLSRYLIKLPQSAIEPLKLQKGSAFGVNIPINEADWVNRNRFIEFVPGTGVYKMPSVFPNYILAGKEETPSGKNICPIPTVLSKNGDNQNYGGEFTGFKDIKGHWAETVINEFAQKGYVSGSGEGVFGPDRSITKAEFLQIFANVTGFDKSGGNDVSTFAITETEKQEVPKAYFDVNTDEWYAAVIYNAKEAGLIDENIVPDVLIDKKLLKSKL